MAKVEINPNFLTKGKDYSGVLPELSSLKLAYQSELNKMKGANPLLLIALQNRLDNDDILFSLEYGPGYMIQPYLTPELQPRIVADRKRFLAGTMNWAYNFLKTNKDGGVLAMNHDMWQLVAVTHLMSQKLTTADSDEVGKTLSGIYGFEKRREMFYGLYGNILDSAENVFNWGGGDHKPKAYGIYGLIKSMYNNVSQSNRW